MVEQYSHDAARHIHRLSCSVAGGLLTGKPVRQLSTDGKGAGMARLARAPFHPDKLPASHIYATDGERAARKDHSGACCGAVARSHAASGAFDTH
ncbi:hypothetical protein [Burkholderia ubonensis]|uniref:hypothetical protein n=1 Tax=Burkholderia ubonensis TaxID=101571 RepID=UPI000B235612|nr:hypothetical protein [Burkholderia ubonensis]